MKKLTIKRKEMKKSKKKSYLAKKRKRKVGKNGQSVKKVSKELWPKITSLKLAAIS